MTEITTKTTKLYGPQQRLYKFPLTVDGQFNTFDELDAYLKSNTTAYPGQIISVIEDEAIYLIVPDKENPNVLKAIRPGIDASELEGINESIEKINKKIITIEGSLNNLEGIDKKFEALESSVAKQLENMEERINNIVITGGASEPIPNEELDKVFNNSVDRLTTEYEFEIIPENVLDDLFDESLNGTGTIRPSEGEYNPIPKNTLEELFKNSIKIQ